MMIAFKSWSGNCDTFVLFVLTSTDCFFFVCFFFPIWIVMSLVLGKGGIFFGNLDILVL